MEIFKVPYDNPKREQATGRGYLTDISGVHEFLRVSHYLPILGRLINTISKSTRESKKHPGRWSNG